jgi:hypothetical protein
MFKYSFYPAGLLLLLVNNGWAQNANSIYSAYGIGDIQLRTQNGYSSMGGLGIALKSDRTLNDLNPASYGALAHYRYMLEVSAVGSTVRYVTEEKNIGGSDFGVKRAAFGMSIAKNMGTVFGLKKYSNVGYKSYADKYVAGTNEKLQEIIVGNGGLNLAYIGNAYNFGKHLSVGVTTGIIFGSISKTETLSIGSAGTLDIVSSDYYQKFYFNAGVQYQFKTGKYQWMLGATLQPGVQLNREGEFIVTDGSDSLYASAVPTHGTFDYPLQWGAGLTLVKGKSTFGFDYIRQNWSATGYRGDGFTSTNHQNFALGYSYTFKKNTFYGPRDGISIMAGVQRDQSYIIINGLQVTSNMATLGFNFPSKNGMFNYTVGFRGGERGRVSYPLVKEKFVDLTLNISLGGFFLTGMKKYD